MTERIHCGIAGLLLLTFLIRAWHAGQPIVENYVGRQVPTAMVARNLERGSGPLRPRLDTAPFPNYFLVEPPLFECGVVVLKRSTGLGLEEAGRILSAMSTALAAWGLFGLMLPRQGRRAALLVVSAFAVFPLTVRYGRAFQPDAAMLGAVVAGMACWDRYQARGRRHWLVAGWTLLALGFALKVTAAVLLIPLLFAIARRRRLPEMLAACSTSLPSLAWYLWADHLVGGADGSRASADNRAIWLHLLGPSALFRRETLEFVARFLFVRAFTPLGVGLALYGLLDPGRTPEGRRGLRLWRAWGISTLVAMAFLAEKLHHEYYWLLLAPVVAAGVGRSLDRVALTHGAVAVALAVMLALLCVYQGRSTWRTPPEWVGLEAAGLAVSRIVPRDAWVVAPEALLFRADRRGCRMEWTSPSSRRAAGEWGGAGAGAEVVGPLDLLEFYRRRGARYFADLGAGDRDPRRKGLHEFVRRRYKVMMDTPEVIIADLVGPETHRNAN